MPAPNEPSAQNHSGAQNDVSAASEASQPSATTLPAASAARDVTDASAERAHRARSGRRAEMLPGLLLIAATGVALVLANSAASGAWHGVVEARLGPLTVHEWVAEWLLAVFFFVTGVELREEFSRGSLSTPRRALTPIMAALGGMVVPAVIFVAFTAGGSAAHGWAIPTATDIAFAVSLLALVAPGVPAPARAFLLALAVADDLFAMIVLAVFYTPGLHPTIVAVVLGLLIGPWVRPRLRRMLEQLSVWIVVPAFALVSAGVPLWGGGAGEVSDAAVGAGDAGEVSDAAVVAGGAGALALGADPVFFGVFLGLVVGKPVGIILATWIVQRIGRAWSVSRARRAGTAVVQRTSASVSWPDLWVVALLAGVGFTMSLLVAQLAFSGGGADAVLHTEHATLGVLAASFVAPVLAGISYRLLRRRRK
ncbi:Na+/H+ antiporter NhaA [Pseudoclavibacter sp. CFCC 13611]|uniref:Na+/H+ antiporter NhaA n=1 Tax=Pseudoclavibacter sp. CFCC 13611 TaxID=2615178 RepID=UPI00130132AE|nr:Na+/H+ antiporter NhaA [Pseudoclavibacter sp. CFCC 13611]KAB1663057.1 Na+/H+ antiporter NhaA [Pseudoclavibacter sp. CFCC 13611]